MESKIKKLTARLEHAVAIKNDLSLVENDRGRFEGTRERLRTSSSLVDEFRVYGRETDREAILDLLMNDSDVGIGDIGVVSIVGMGGVGKTTLAQLVYNDVKVESFFDRSPNSQDKMCFCCYQPASVLPVENVGQCNLGFLTFSM